MKSNAFAPDRGRLLRLLRLCALAVLCSPGLALAQDAPDRTERVQGVIVRLDHARGVLELRPNPDARTGLTIRGTPAQLQRYREGEVASLQVARYGERRWLTGEADGALEAGAEAPAPVRGTVASVEAGEGLLTVQTAGGEAAATFRAHPAQLEDVTPGQLVSVTYQSVHDSAWVEAVQAETAPVGDGGAGDAR